MYADDAVLFFQEKGDSRQVSSTVGKYLGTWIDQHKNKKNIFDNVVNKIQSKLQMWKSKCLSQAGRATLIKEILLRFIFRIGEVFVYRGRKVMSAKYMDGNNLGLIKRKTNSSWMWKAILKAKDIVLGNLKWQVGNVVLVLNSPPSHADS
ncbi:Reverse transcriptase zinc-binding domain [Senna tora]|uniref:Reverse transcriptase zinc-binding domain n=1 Tax=Senna tora TaxID=362788 RepID=A0A834TPV0_9FABA|nr:Reverse transcriptase zinc-binding domain [Senna tora]